MEYQLSTRSYSSIVEAFEFIGQKMVSTTLASIQSFFCRISLYISLSNCRNWEDLSEIPILIEVCHIYPRIIRYALIAINLK